MSANFLQDLISSLLERTPKFGGSNDSRSIDKLCDALKIASGENSIRNLGTNILEQYQLLDSKGRLEFFTVLAERFDVDADLITQLAQAYKAEPTAANLGALLHSSEPSRQDLMRRLNHVPGATQVLVAMRSDLLKISKNNEPLKRLDLDFAHLFSSWFNRGFLIEERVTWDSSASVLAKIIQYEAVHAINDWDDLRRRLQPPDRRCFAFFHPAMPNEPLVFVEVALCKGTPNSIQKLLEEDRTPINPREADTAVFYSISNCQAGLRGISFGNSLIKQVANDLARELPQLTTFVTLSPLPGFAQWLRTSCSDLPNAAIDFLQTTSSAFYKEENAKDLQRWSETLRHLGARYLYSAKRDDGTPVDPVARFHLNNGASLQDIHAMADISTNSLTRSYGLMVNYLYELKQVEKRHEDFASLGKIHASKIIRNYSNNTAPIVNAH